MFLALLIKCWYLRKLISIFVLSLVIFSAQGQTLKGVVVDEETAKPLANVTIFNLSTELSTSTEETGNFHLLAKTGDIIAFSAMGYRTEKKPATPGTEMRIELIPLNVKLPTYVFRDLTPFQRDSIELTTLYSKELNTKPVKVGFSSANGGGITGLIGAPVKKMSKSYKQNKKFKENFKSDMEQRYIDTKYTPVLVNSLTTFTGDTLAIFMNTYPMEYDFARVASDLEIKLWIRNNYRDYLHKTPQ